VETPNRRIEDRGFPCVKMKHRAAEIDPGRASSHFQLWGRVLALGIKDSIAENLGIEEFYPSALQWFLNNSRRSCGSALWICETLNLHIEPLRSFVLTASVDEFKALKRALY
jgi:hypothetical protein